MSYTLTTKDILMEEIDKCIYLENEKWTDYQEDFEEFKDDIPKLEKTIDMLNKVKKYLKNNE